MIAESICMQSSGFSVMETDELFLINGGETQESEKSDEKKSDKEWKLTVSAGVHVDSNGNTTPQISVGYTVSK